MLKAEQACRAHSACSLVSEVHSTRVKTLLPDADEINEGGGKLDIQLWDYKFRNHCLVSAALCQLPSVQWKLRM